MWFRSGRQSEREATETERGRMQGEAGWPGPGPAAGDDLTGYNNTASFLLGGVAAAAADGVP
jgi:hypothetical protein